MSCLDWDYGREIDSICMRRCDDVTVWYSDRNGIGGSFVLGVWGVKRNIVS